MARDVNTAIETYLANIAWFKKDLLAERELLLQADARIKEIDTTIADLDSESDFTLQRLNALTGGALTRDEVEARIIPTPAPIAEVIPFSTDPVQMAAITDALTKGAAQ